MARLSHSDLEGVLTFLSRCDAFPDTDSLRHGMLLALADLIPCDTNAYNEVDRATGEPYWIVEPSDSMERADHDAFVRWVGQHPIVSHHAAHGGSAVKLSDFLTRRELHGLELYDEFFKALEIEHQIVIGVPGSAQTLIGIPINRTGADFTERERLMLDTLRPHLAQVFRRARARTQARHALALLEAAAERCGHHLLVLDPSGQIQAASPRAVDLLHDYFADGYHTGDTLPGAVSAWLRERPRAPLAGHSEGRQATLTFLPATSRGEPDAVLLEEDRTTLDPRRTEALGLTRREAQVLCLADRGLTSAQIGAELDVSVRTVDKHLERVYAKLGVPGRTAALARAREAAA
jgi:DNA-binding CsgD family transcriptional regulator